MRPATALLFAGALAASSFVVACRSPAPSVPLAPDDPLPAALMLALEERSASLDSLRGVASLSVDSPELRFRRPQRFAAQRPDSLRVETLGLFSQIAAILVTRGDRYQFFDASNPGVQEGPVTDDLLAQIAGIELPPRDVVELMLGTPPVSADLQPHAARRLGDGGTLVPLRDRSGTQVDELEFDALGRLRVFHRMADAAGPEWQARFEEYRDVGGIPFAHVVELRFPERDSLVSLHFDEIELNPELSPDLFVLRMRRAMLQLQERTPAG